MLRLRHVGRSRSTFIHHRKQDEMAEFTKRLTDDESGASAVEYGLLVALIAAVIVLAVFGLGIIVHNAFQTTCNSLENPGPMSTTDADCTK